MINLCLVVIATQFSETKRRETERMQHERAMRRRDSDSSGVSLSPALSTSVSVFSTGASCYSEMIRYVEHLMRRAWRRVRSAVVELRRRRRAANAGEPTATADESTTRRRLRKRRRRGRRKAGATTPVDVEMNSISLSPRGACATGSRRQHHVTLASPPPHSSCGSEAPSNAADDVLAVSVRPASPLAPRASPEPSEVDQSSLALNRSVSGEPRLMPSSATLTQPRNPRWSSPSGMEEFDVSADSRANDIRRTRKPRSASSPRLHSHQTVTEEPGVTTDFITYAHYFLQ